MNRSKSLSFLPVLLLAALSLASCSGPYKPCTVNCGGTGTATVSLTLVADTLPPNPSILSFKVTIVAITLTPTSGTALTFQPPSPIVIDLMRLQSDTALLGSLTNVPSGSYTVQVSLSSPEITFLNDTSSTITANGVRCLSNHVCTATITSVGTPTIGSFTLSATSGGKQGIEFDFNLNNAISLSSGTLAINFNPSSPSPGVLTAFTLPRTNANLGANQLELTEDFTGVVSISGSNVTITSPTRGTLTATSTSNSFFDPSPDGVICPTPSTISCVVAGQIASVDAFLKSDGTLELKEFEPLNANQQDFVEGTVYAVNTPTQFAIAVTDKVQLATNSLISGLNTGDLLTVDITTPTFLVDTKGLAVPAGSLGQFQGQSDTNAVHPGQTIALHVTVFVAANGTTIAAATADTVILRWSRLIATPTTASATTVNVNAVPSYFNITPASVFPTQVFSGTLGSQGVTNLDGITTAANLIIGAPVGLRVLYLENTTNSAQFPFMAAKIRQH
ncbi:MAG TPA: hypothetical protein VK937_10750 [Candidatus Limnocylindria bacterium]|nr:hypothetical protein [Candidatus Limnocylindria bacterium]